MRIRWVVGCAALALILVLGGCASQGPVVHRPPTVRVSELTSLSFTPDLVKFRAKVLIRNISNGDMTFERTDYAVDLFDTQLFSDTFADMLKTRGGGTQTVTFPFQISMEDIMKQGVNLLNEEGLRVVFHGQVLCDPSYGYDAIPFDATLTIPIPKMPSVTYLGSDGTPFTGSFRIRLAVSNPNEFPFTVDSINTYLVLNDTRYNLLRTDNPAEIPAGGSGVVVLQMKSTPEKALSMALNLAQSGDQGPELDLAGTVTLSTRYGWVYVPVSVKQALGKAGAE